MLHPMRNYANVINRLKRRRAKMTGRSIAKQAGISEQQVCDVIKGRAMPSPKLIEWLGYEIGYFRKKNLVSPPRPTTCDTMIGSPE